MTVKPEKKKNWLARRAQSMGENNRRFWRWTRQTIDMLCDRPDHLQRLFIIGSGMSVFPMVCGFVFLLIRYGDRSDELASMVVPILGNGMYISQALFALSIIALLGIVRGIGIRTPGGFGFNLQTTSGPQGKVEPFDLPDFDDEGGGGRGPHRGDNMEGV